MSFDSIAIANYLIERARQRGEMLTPMRVQKLVYFAHGWNLAINDQPLLRERIEAWKYGPVVPALYEQLKEYGSRPIPAPVQVMRVEDNRIAVVRPTLDATDGDTTATKELLDRVWDVYGQYSAVQLSNATHAAGSPWHVTWQGAAGASHAVIDDDLIKMDFLRRAAKAAAPTPV